jgi:uncharacterized protein
MTTTSRPPQAAGPPPRYKLAVITWLAVYPAITAVVAVFEPIGLLNTPVPIRTLLLTIVLVPIMVYVLVPVLSRVLAEWLHR